MRRSTWTRAAACGVASLSLLATAMSTAVAVDNEGDPNPYTQAVLASQPDLYWQFNDAPGSTQVADSSGNNVHGDLTQVDPNQPTISFKDQGLGGGGTAHFAPGTRGGYIIPSNMANFNPIDENGKAKDGAVVMWLRSSGDEVLEPEPRDPFADEWTTSLFRLGLPAPSDKPWEGRDPDFGGINFMHTGAIETFAFSRDQWGKTGTCCGGSSDINDSNWHQVAVVFDAADINIFIDGKDISPRWDMPESITRDSIWVFGNELESRRSVDIDELAMYSRALTDAEVTSLYQLGKALPAPTPKPVEDLLSETFPKNASKSWGNNWDLSSPSSFAVNSGAGSQRVNPGKMSIANAKNVTVGHFNATFDFTVTKKPQGNGVYIQHQFGGSGLGRDGYAARAIVSPSGNTTLDIFDLRTGKPLITEKFTGKIVAGNTATLTVNAAPADGKTQLTATLTSGDHHVDTSTTVATSTGRYAVATYNSSGATTSHTVNYDNIRITPGS